MSPEFVTSKIGRCFAHLYAVLAVLFSWPAAAAAGIVWEQEWELRVNGQQLSVKTFASSLSPEAVARQLVQADRGYERYLVAQGRILLSGMTSGQHHLADVQASPGGSHGYVSTLFFESARDAAVLQNRHAVGPTPIHKAAGAGESAGPLHVFEFPSSVTVRLTNSKGLPPSDPIQDQTGGSIIFTPSGHSPDLGVSVFMPE